MGRMAIGERSHICGILDLMNTMGEPFVVHNIRRYHDDCPLDRNVVGRWQCKPKLNFRRCRYQILVCQQVATKRTVKEKYRGPPQKELQNPPPV